MVVLLQTIAVDPSHHVRGADAIHLVKLADVDLRAWLPDVLKRLPDHPAKRIHELLPYVWKLQLAVA